jgi:hypothetical protein
MYSGHSHAGKTWQSAMSPSSAFADAARWPSPGVRDQAGAGPDSFVILAAKQEDVPGGQLGEVSTEAVHIAPIWPVSALVSCN